MPAEEIEHKPYSEGTLVKLDIFKLYARVGLPVFTTSSFIIHTSTGPLFKGRDEFLAEPRQHLTAEGPVVIKGKRTIHGMGGVGKTRAAIEHALKHDDNYHALLFISAETPEALHRNLAALCGPLVLNLPEQNEKGRAPRHSLHAQKSLARFLAAPIVGT